MTQPAALALTWLVELLVAAAITGRRDVRLVVVVVVASLCTHPWVWWLGAHTPPARWWPSLLVAEAVVAVVEGIFVRWAAREPRGVLAGVAMNLCSFGVGLALSPFLR